MRPKSMLLPEEVPDIEKVGKFEDDKVEEQPENNIHHDQEGSCWNNFFKNVKYNILGVTVKATIVWAIVYVIAIIINVVGDSWAANCEEEQLWTINAGQKLVNHHHAKVYGWGLQQSTENPEIFYIKSKEPAKCSGIKWYDPHTPKTTNLEQTNTKPKPSQTNNSPKDLNSGRQKRVATEVGAAATLICPTLTTSMGNAITPQEFKPKKKEQMWKKEPCKTKKDGTCFGKTEKYFRLNLLGKNLKDILTKT
jgi:hypothetical protein